MGKYITLSTGHLTPETKNTIDAYIKSDLSFDNNHFLNQISVYDKTDLVTGEVYGYFIYFEKDQYNTCPKDLQDCLRYAQAQNADFVIFDSDEPPTTNLPYYYGNAYQEIRKMTFAECKQQLLDFMTNRKDDDTGCNEIISQYIYWLESKVNN